MTANMMQSALSCIGTTSYQIMNHQVPKHADFITVSRFKTLSWRRQCLSCWFCPAILKPQRKEPAPGPFPPFIRWMMMMMMMMMMMTLNWLRYLTHPHPIGWSHHDKHSSPFLAPSHFLRENSYKRHIGTRPQVICSTCLTSSVVATAETGTSHQGSFLRLSLWICKLVAGCCRYMADRWW